MTRRLAGQRPRTAPAPVFAGLAVAVLLAGAPAVAENWPHWRGPRFDGTSTAVGVPSTWSRTENVRWRLELPGEGASTPVVWGDRLFLTSTREGSDELLLLAVGRGGEVLWERAVGAGTVEVAAQFAHETSPASPSPVTDGERVWALFGTGTLLCAAAADGSVVWSVDLFERYGEPSLFFGLAASPLFRDGNLYVPWLHAEGQTVFALDAATGAEIWRHERPTDARLESLHAYASPVPFAVRGGPELLLIHGADYLSAHRMESGAEVWRFGTLNPGDGYNPMFRQVATPVVAGGLLVVPTAQTGPVFALEPGASSGPIPPSSEKVTWTLDSGTPDVPSPVVVDGLVYLPGKDGKLVVVEAGTGEVVYRERVHQGPHRGSPVVVDGRLLVPATDGTVSVLRAGRTFEVVAKNDVGEWLAASPAISDGVLYLRTFEALWAIGEGGEGGAAAESAR